MGHAKQILDVERKDGLGVGSVEGCVREATGAAGLDRASHGDAGISACSVYNSATSLSANRAACCGAGGCVSTPTLTGDRAP